MTTDLSRLSDDELIDSLKRLARDDRRHLVAMLKHLAEFDRRKLAIERGFTSLFAYCVKELRLSEGEAYRRIHAARAAAAHRIFYRALERGLITLTSMSLLAPRLTRENHRDLLRRASGLSTREVEALVATLSPKPGSSDRVRYLGPTPEPSRPSKPVAEASPENLFALADPARDDAPGPEPDTETEPVPVRVEFKFAADQALLRNVDRAKDLLRHKYPAARLEEVFAEALAALLDRIDPDRRLRRPRRAAGSVGRDAAPRRNIPQRVKDEVWKRDQGSCVFVGQDDRRCQARAGLEYDHVRPWAKGGSSDDPANIRLLCRAHNDLEARRAFGDRAVDAALARRRRG